MELVDYFMPTKIIYGDGAASCTGEEVKARGGSKVFLVSDQGLCQAGVVDNIRAILAQSGLECTVYVDVQADPPIENVAGALEAYRSGKCDFIVAVGGGSVICLAKGVALLAANGGNLRDYEGFSKVHVKPISLVVLPTTAGSGSEVSQFFIISDHERHKKMAVGSPLIFPDLTILDADLMVSLPYWQGIVSGLDALTHAIESCFSTRTSPLTESLAFDAVRLIFRYLLPASASRDREKKMQMLLASVMANIACGNSRLGLVHAMADPLSVYFHFPHGYANGLMLPFVMDFNLLADPTQGKRLAQAMAEGAGNMEFVTNPLGCLQNLYLQAGFPLKLPVDISEKIENMVSDVMDNDLLVTNVRPASAENVRNLYEKTSLGWPQVVN